MRVYDGVKVGETVGLGQHVRVYKIFNRLAPQLLPTPEPRVNDTVNVVSVAVYGMKSVLHGTNVAVHELEVVYPSHCPILTPATKTLKNSLLRSPLISPCP